MMHRPKVLLLDEPTAALDAANIAKLERLVATALEHGTAILYVAHRLDEVQRLADQLTVIRDGRIQGTYGREAWEVDDIVAMMVGVRTDLAFPTKPQRTGTEPVLLDAHGFKGAGFGPVDVTVRTGEIVGIAGAEGNGQHELVRTLVGLRSGQGDVQMEGRQIHARTPAGARRHGIVFQSGDRAAESVFRELSVMDNATLAARSELGPFGTIACARASTSFFDPVSADYLGVSGRVAGPTGRPALSGGNQQKAVLARSSSTRPRCWSSTSRRRGSSARARLDIYRAVRRQADDGMGIVARRQLLGCGRELEGLCDRILRHVRGGRDLASSPATRSASPRSSSRSSTSAGGAPRPSRSRRARACRRGRARCRRSSARPGRRWSSSRCSCSASASTPRATRRCSSPSSNLSSLLVIALPLIVVALGQQAALIRGGFDVSIRGEREPAGVVLPPS